MSLQPSASPAALTSVDRAIALARGFEPGEACPECQNLTLARDGSTLTCRTCDVTIVELSKLQWLRHIGAVWPDRWSVFQLLTGHVEATSDAWARPQGALERSLLGFADSVDGAKTPEQCWDAFFGALERLAAPQPDSSGITLKVIS